MQGVQMRTMRVAAHGARVVRDQRPLYAAIGETLKESLKTYNLLDERNWYITPADEDW